MGCGGPSRGVRCGDAAPGGARGPARDRVHRGRHGPQPVLPRPREHPDRHLGAHDGRVHERPAGGAAHRPHDRRVVEVPRGRGRHAGHLARPRRIPHGPGRQELQRRHHGGATGVGPLRHVPLDDRRQRGRRVLRLRPRRAGRGAQLRDGADGLLDGRPRCQGRGVPVRHRRDPTGPPLLGAVRLARLGGVRHRAGTAAREPLLCRGLRPAAAEPRRGGRERQAGLHPARADRPHHRGVVAERDAHTRAAPGRRRRGDRPSDGRAAGPWARRPHGARPRRGQRVCPRRAPLGRQGDALRGVRAGADGRRPAHGSRREDQAQRAARDDCGRRADRRPVRGGPCAGIGRGAVRRPAGGRVRRGLAAGPPRGAPRAGLPRRTHLLRRAVRPVDVRRARDG